MRILFSCLFLIVLGYLEAQLTDNRLANLNDTYEDIKNDSLLLAKTHILEALQIGNSSTDESLKARTYRNAADLYYLSRNLDSADYFISQAKSFALLAGDSLELVKALSDIGLFAFHRNRFVISQKFYLEALKIAERNGYTNEVNDISGRVGFLYTMEERFGDAYPYARKHFESLKPLGGTDLIKATFNLANLLKRMKKYEESLAYLDTMKVMVDSMGFVYGQAKMYGMRAYVLMEQKHFEDAEVAIANATKLFAQVNSSMDLVQMQLALSNLELERGDYIKMDRQMDKVTLLIDEVKDDNEIMIEYYDALYRSKKGVGQSAEALQALEKKTQIRDSIFNSKSAKQRDELIEQYETAKKDQEIENMTQQATIQALNLRARNYQLIAGGFAAVLILGFVLFRSKQRSAKSQQQVVEVEQRLLRLQMNPHFIFNTLSIIHSMLGKGESEKAALYLVKFSKMMRQTLEFSRVEFIPLEDELELLTSYVETQRICTGQHISYKIESEESIDVFDTLVPPMFAQPFIENVFLHAGLDENPEKGKLRVLFRKTEKNLQLLVEDNGKGIRNKESAGDHKSRALKITQDRLVLLSKKYNQRLKVNIDSTDQGTRILVDLPLLS